MAGKAYWQAKIWGILHDPALKALHNNQSGRGENSFWKNLAVMQDWVANNLDPEKSGKTILEHIKVADYIASASDRGAIGAIPAEVNYKEDGLELTHLLSGASQFLKLKDPQHQQLIGDRRTYLQNNEKALESVIPDSIKDDEQAVFWWLWRCLPEATCQLFDDNNLHLMPAETRLPDSSIWSHASMTAALSGALAGYDLTLEDMTKNWSGEKSHAYLAVFTFSPIQELIKASRKIKDFWAGSWILHYLSAKVCWELAQQYGPDCFLYPSLYGQPLIDHWLLKKYPDFDDWVNEPTDRKLLTAGFPNVIMLVLPKAKVAPAMQSAKNHLLRAWRDIAKDVFEELQERHWQTNLKETDPSWQNWLNAQWQTYWSAVAIGADGAALKSKALVQKEGEQNIEEKQENLQDWIKRQNQAFASNPQLFTEKEQAFQTEAAKRRMNNQGRYFSVNVGSWWADIFGQTRLALNSVKNARNWKLPTAFGPRSTISGIGPVVHPKSDQHHQDWVTEGETQHYWRRNAGLFDGSEQLNATETVKRGLEKILPKLLDRDPKELKAYYPDLTVGVAGYLKTQTEKDVEALAIFHRACGAIAKKIQQDHHEIARSVTQEWGIPWIDENQDEQYCRYHPRLLNAGWLVEELENLDKDDLKTYRQELQKTIQEFYPNNNPTSWYAIAAGDGDSMSDWLKGKPMESYAEYFPEALKVPDDLQTTFQPFSEEKKRMGPATHNALSRALLDFSNQLAPYLTEERYAGRLIYSGGDDVLAYTNLWEWDEWLWDIRQCFIGQTDPKGEFKNDGDYWQSKTFERPLFTMGKNATISFGVVIAHHSVPLAIALENLWEAEDGAKDHRFADNKKDAVQLRVIYSNGNILKATCKFETFKTWQNLLTIAEIEHSTFETAATLLEQHPIPCSQAIAPWVNAFTERRSNLDDDQKTFLRSRLTEFLISLWNTTNPDDWEQEAKNWLKAAAFNLRTRNI